MQQIRDRILTKAAVQKIPIMAAFELLPVCNLSCKMCYVRKSMSYVTQHGGLMNAQQWIDYAKEARELGLLYPLLTGGEPFLHPEFQEIYYGIHKQGMQVSINTNGTLIDQKMAQWLSRHAPTRINLTLYGSSEETYERLCGDGSAYKKVLDAVRWLKKYQIPLKFNASITQENLPDLKAMIEYAKGVESPIQIATYMFPPVRRDQDMIGTNHRMTPDEAGLARVQADFYQNEPGWFRVQADRFSHFKDPDLAVQEGEKQELSIRCRAGLCSFWIDWQGNLVNCGMYGSAQTPLKGKALKDAWQDLVEKTAQVRYAPVCASCANRELCHPCIAMVCNECGDKNGKPEYLCRMNQASARYYQEYAKKLPDICSMQIKNNEVQNYLCGLE